MNSTEVSVSSKDLVITVLPTFPPAVPGTLVGSCSSSYLAQQNAILNLILVLPNLTDCGTHHLLLPCRGS